jgi:hypothetical protein
MVIFQRQGERLKKGKAADYQGGNPNPTGRFTINFHFLGFNSESQSIFLEMSAVNHWAFHIGEQESDFTVAFVNSLTF